MQDRSCRRILRFDIANFLKLRPGHHILQEHVFWMLGCFLTVRERRVDFWSLLTERLQFLEWSTLDIIVQHGRHGPMMTFVKQHYPMTWKLAQHGQRWSALVSMVGVVPG